MIVRKGEGKNIPLGEDNWIFCLTGDDTSGHFDLIESEISYLQGPPLHVHKEQNDTFMVLDGTLTVQVGEDIYELGAGDVACAKHGTPHTYTNLNKDKKVRVINIMSPGHFDKALQDFSQLTPEEIMGEKINKVAEKHNVQIVGPPIPVKLGLV